MFLMSHSVEVHPVLLENPSLLRDELGKLKREMLRNVDAGKLNYKQPLLDIIVVGRYSNP